MASVFPCTPSARLAVIVIAAQVITQACGRKRDESVTPLPELLKSAGYTTQVQRQPERPWVLVRDEDGLFEVLMPDTPLMQRTAGGGVALTMNDSENGSFNLSVQDAPPAKEARGNLEGILDAIERGIVAGVDRNDKQPIRRLEISGYPARELLFPAVGTTSFVESYLFCFAKMRYLFRVRHFGPSEARDRFYGSLKLNGVPRTPAPVKADSGK